MFESDYACRKNPKGLDIQKKKKAAIILKIEQASFTAYIHKTVKKM